LINYLVVQRGGIRTLCLSIYFIIGKQNIFWKKSELTKQIGERQLYRFSCYSLFGAENFIICYNKVSFRTKEKSGL